MLEIGKNYYYVGVNIEELVNTEVTVIEQDGYCGTKQDCPVYKVVDMFGELRRIPECNLDVKQHLDRKFIYWGLQDCFPDTVGRFESFTPRGRDIGDIQ